MNTANHRAASQRNDPTQFVLGIDIGGTSIKPILFALKDGKMSEETFALDLPEGNETKVGKGAHLDQMEDIFASAKLAAEQHGGVLSGIGIGSPGRFDPITGEIKKATNNNIGPNGSLDGVSLRDEYLARLGDIGLKDVAIKVDNDALAMRDGILSGIVNAEPNVTMLQTANEEARGKKELLGKQIALLGLGTGVGHSIARMKGTNDWETITDGHGVKALVTLDKVDQEVLKRAKKHLKPEHQPEGRDSKITGESLFKSPMYNAIVAAETQAGKSDKDANASAIAFTGKYMARNIAAIAAADVDDYVKDNEWSAKEKSEAAKTNVYIVSGGLGSSNDGLELMRVAQRELESIAAIYEQNKQHELATTLKNIELWQYKGSDKAQNKGAEAAQRAAASMVLGDVLQQRSGPGA